MIYSNRFVRNCMIDYSCRKISYSYGVAPNKAMAMTGVTQERTVNVQLRKKQLRKKKLRKKVEKKKLFLVASLDMC